MAKSKKISKADDQIEELMVKPAAYIGRAAKSDTGRMIGAWAFILGFVIAVLAGIFAGLSAAGWQILDVNATSLLIGILALIGLVVGIVNISDKNAISFLIGAIAIAGTSGGLSALANLQMTVFPAVAVFITTLMQMISYFVVPAAVIVGLRVIYASARGE
jgi:hypothetical protein